MENLCRLCLKENPEHQVPITQKFLEILNVLHIQLDLANIENPVMCRYCYQRMKHFFNFKSTCVLTEDFLQPHINSGNSRKTNLKEVFAKENRLVDKNKEICRFCLTMTEIAGCVALQKLIFELRYANMLRNYLSEVSLNSVEDPKVCKLCVRNLDDLNMFIQRLAKVSEKMNDQRLPGTNYSHSLSIEVSNSTEPHEIKQEEDSIAIEESNASNKMFKDVRNTPGTVKIETDIGKYVADLTIYSQDSITELKLNEEKMLIDLNEEDVLHTREDLLPPEVQRDNHENQYAILKNALHDTKSARGYYYCANCDFNSVEKSNLREHILRKHSKSVYKQQRMKKCDLCDYKTYILRDMKNHKVRHLDWSDVVHFKCSICDAKFRWKPNLRRHMRVHDDPLRVGNSYKCDKCEYECKLKHNMMQHKEQGECRKLLYKCEKCDYQIKSKFSFDAHLEIHKDASERKMYPCPYCDRLLSNPSSLRVHKLTQHSSKEYKCKECDYRTKNVMNFDNHKKCHDPDSKKIACKKCNFKTATKTGLNRHMYVHETVKNVFNCDQCHFKTAYKNHLTKHQFSHGAELAFNCSKCKFGTNNKQYLKKHIEKHDDPLQKVLKCSDCSYATFQKTYLTKHRQKCQFSHEAEPAFRCSKCKFGTNNKQYLKKHIKKHDDLLRKVLICSDCSYVTFQKTSLNKHRQKCH